MNTQQRIREFIDKLIAEGNSVLGTKWVPQGNWLGDAPVYVDLSAYTTWRARCKLLATQLGPVGRVWEEHLNAELPNKVESAISTQGILKAIQQSAAEGLLLRFEDLVYADAFASLLEQAEYVHGQGYFLAAGVLLRAVLEERLRRLCDQKSLTIAKPKPSLNDYNTELYKATIYDKITMKEIDALIAIGNDAAHNVPTLTAEHVGRLLEGVLRVLQKFSS